MYVVVRMLVDQIAIVDPAKMAARIRKSICADLYFVVALQRIFKLIGITLAMIQISNFRVTVASSWTKPTLLSSSASVTPMQGIDLSNLINRDDRKINNNLTSHGTYNQHRANGVESRPTKNEKAFYPYSKARVSGKQKDHLTTVQHRHLRHSSELLKPDQSLTASIVGGTPVTSVTDFPSFGRNVGGPVFINGTLLDIEDKLAFACGGTLIHEDIFLTSAFCERDFINGVYIGGLKLNGTDSEYVPVSYTYPHPDFDPDLFVNDIMIVKLAMPSTRPIQALNLNDDSIPEFNASVTIIGFGQISEEDAGIYSESLRQVQVPVLEFAQCANYYGDPLENERTQICAGSTTGGKGKCYGDGGGPLLLSKSSPSSFIDVNTFSSSQTYNSNDMIQIGIASYMNGCARPDSFPGYTRVSAFKEYIVNGICSGSEKPPKKCKKKPKRKRRRRQRRLSCGNSLQCGFGWNLISKKTYRGNTTDIDDADNYDCMIRCVRQRNVKFYLRSEGWSCGQVCFSPI